MTTWVLYRDSASGPIYQSHGIYFLKKPWLSIGGLPHGIPPESICIIWDKSSVIESFRQTSVGRQCCTERCSLKPGTHHAIFVVCWTQRRRKDDCCMVCAHQRQLSPVDFTNATVVGPIRKTNRSNNCCMVCAGQRHLSHQPTGHRPITVKHFRDA